MKRTIAALTAAALSVVSVLASATSTAAASPPTAADIPVAGLPGDWLDVDLSEHTDLGGAEPDDCATVSWSADVPAVIEAGDTAPCVGYLGLQLPTALGQVLVPWTVTTQDGTASALLKVWVTEDGQVPEAPELLPTPTAPGAATLTVQAHRGGPTPSVVVDLADQADLGTGSLVHYELRSSDSALAGLGAALDEATGVLTLTPTVAGYRELEWGVVTSGGSSPTARILVYISDDDPSPIDPSLVPQTATWGLTSWQEGDAGLFTLGSIYSEAQCYESGQYVVVSIGAPSSERNSPSTPPRPPIANTGAGGTVSVVAHTPAGDATVASWVTPPAGTEVWTRDDLAPFVASLPARPGEIVAHPEVTPFDGATSTAPGPAVWPSQASGRSQYGGAASLTPAVGTAVAWVDGDPTDPNSASWPLLHSRPGFWHVSMTLDIPDDVQSVTLRLTQLDGTVVDATAPAGPTPTCGDVQDPPAIDPPVIDQPADPDPPAGALAVDPVVGPAPSVVDPPAAPPIATHPSTGADPWPLAIVAAALIAGGAGLVAARRRAAP